MPAGLDSNPDPIVSDARNRVLDRVATEIAAGRSPESPFLVAIDGIDGAGKSTFADELSARLSQRGFTVIRSTIDWFHRPREERYAKGRSSPAGFYLDSHDLGELQTRLLDPLRQGAGATYQLAAFDEPADEVIDCPEVEIGGNEVLVFDGIFLCRPELIEHWDYVVFLEARQRVDLERLEHTMTDAPAGGLELVAHVLEWVERIERYSAGMRFYLDTADPTSRADIVIDNNNLASPTIVGSERFLPKRRRVADSIRGSQRSQS